ncbi:hypothetical protein V6N12_024779 [Hibiscus sabdariffa]|uniref:Uncharacterized protein n=1 Tax=Hibiscus sabdariffa TaxID=183260 RepID=A0ABR2B9D5_9ROSI
MAWSAVASAVTTIGKLVGEEAVYLWGVENQVDRLQTELKWMQSALVEADVKQYTDERIRLCVAEIRELAYDAEDVIEDFALRVGSKRKGGVSGCIKRSACILNEGWELHQTRSKIDEILKRILDLVRRLQVYGVKGSKDGKGSSSLSVRRELRRPYPHIIDQNIVGLNNALEELVPVLVEEGSHTHCRVVSIWGMGEAWDRLKPAFPTATDRSNSRILLTTRNEEIVSHADRSCYLYELPFLNEEESWELFQKIVFPPSDSTEDYVIEAQRLIQLWVAEGIVSSKEEGDGEWEVAEDVAEHYLLELAARCMIQPQDRDLVTLKVKTFQLHDEMRFLCLSKSKQDNFLFIVDESNACSLSTMRKIRRISALKFFETHRIECPNLRSLSFFNDTNFLEEIFEVGTPSACEIGPSSKLSSFWDNFAVYIRFLKARGIWVYIFTNLKLLRVLNCEGPYGYTGCKLMGDIGNLIHLRFLSLRDLKFEGSKLTSSLGNLRCLQTLDLRLFGPDDIHVPDVLWMLDQLRHLYLPFPFKCGEKTKLKLGTLRNLLTLVNFNTKNCYLNDLIKMTNLRELEIFGHFEIEDFSEENLDKNPPIFEGKYLRTLSITSSEKIDPTHLNHLLSSCASICKLILHVKLSKLPELNHLFSNLAYIRLEECKLQEDPMTTLEQLPNLRVLELNDGAFLGNIMFCSAQGFPKLESLSLMRLYYLEQWEMGEGAMPCLGRLEITGCSNLDMGPVKQRFNKILKEGID